MRSVGDPLPDTLRIPSGITDVDHEDQRRDCEARGSSKSVANVFFTFSIAYFFREILMQNPCSFLKLLSFNTFYVFKIDFLVRQMFANFSSVLRADCLFTFLLESMQPTFSFLCVFR